MCDSSWAAGKVLVGLLVQGNLVGCLQCGSVWLGHRCHAEDQS